MSDIELAPPVARAVAGPAVPESHVRSITKAFSWRIVATLTTATIAWFVTGQVDTALLIGGIEFFVKFFIYYVHERAWLAVPRF